MPEPKRPIPLNRGIAVKEFGITGERSPMGFKRDEFIPELKGPKKIRKFKEMRDNDPIIGGIMTATEMMMRGTKYRFETDEDQPDTELEFAESLFDDMEHPFSDTLAEIVSFLTFGYDWHEIVYKRRLGESDDPETNSKFTDGRFGIRKFASRPQWSIQRFILGEKGEILGVVQGAIAGHMPNVEIPIDKSLLFRTTTLNNDPQGRSVLRNAYTSYYYVSHIDNIEAIAIERELNGLPVARVPAATLLSQEQADVDFVDQLKQMMRDVKLNDQGYMILPSDHWEDIDGKISSERKIEFNLIASEGHRAIDTDKVITRHQRNMARTILADFIMLGSERGSFALSKSKTDLFLRSMQAYMDSIADTINRHLMPKVWMLNGLSPELMPKLVFNNVAPTDLVELGAFIRDMSTAGIFFDDADTQNILREQAGLPDNVEDDPELLGRRGRNQEEEQEEEDEPDFPQGE